MIWKPLDSTRRFERAPMFHWPYRYDVMSDKTNTAVIPLAIILLYGLALFKSFKEAHGIMLEHTRKRDKP